MVHNTIESLSDATVSKVGILNQSVTRYFILSMMAGVYVGLGIVLVFSIGAPLGGGLFIGAAYWYVANKQLEKE